MSSWLVNVQCKKIFRDARNKLVSILHPMLNDFDYKGEKLDIKDIAEFMSKFGVDYSVLTVDLDLELLILVKTEEGVDIKNKPFLYAAQRLYAVQLLCIPFHELSIVEEVIALNTSNVKTSFLYNTGRCGSTLLCKVLDQLPRVQSISEPDVFAILARHFDERMVGCYPKARTKKATLITITRVAILLLNNYFLFRAPDKICICYKLRSETTHAAELLQKAMPSAKNIYLYRNCFSFGESYARVRVEGNYNLYWLISTLRVDSTYLWYKSKYCHPRVNNCFYQNMGNNPENENVPFRHGFYWCFTYIWWRNIEKAITMIQTYPDHFFHAILRYEDLSIRKEELALIVARKLGYLEENESSSVEARMLSSITSVFKSNSQSGTEMASKRDVENKDDVWYGEWEKQQINDVLQYLGRTVRNGDFFIPGTI
ncbi:uncharacterized protein LOC114537978 [Dendronephthya gigantea]|uniref:uncharacterized protein LOC114537978 n=1 Tax=Dendronephthya gigantea TaxID=151771 RepID=UPI00106915B4|nr:uncharacterized protein LOC114537978 [Dendronephthya gigantea]